MITKKLKKKWDKMDDTQRWVYLIGNPEGLLVMLDNDDTFVVELDEDLRYDESHEDNDLYLRFDQYVGSHAYYLLDACGIQNEGV